jgi:hypothetical protein
MIEASPTKFYLAKYLFLAFALIQWVVMGALLFRFDFSPKNFFVSLIFFTLGLLFLLTFLIVSEKIKRVAVGKNKIVIMDGDKNMRFEWPEVKSLRIVPFLNLYRLKIKGKKGNIYFFPSRNIDPAFGLLSRDTSKMGEIVEKKKKDFGID